MIEKFIDKFLLEKMNGCKCKVEKYQLTLFSDLKSDSPAKMRETVDSVIVEIMTDDKMDPFEKLTFLKILQQYLRSNLLENKEEIP